MQPCLQLREEHSRQRRQLVQRPWGGRVNDVFEHLQGIQYSWSGVSEGARSGGRGQRGDGGQMM